MLKCIKSMTEMVYSDNLSSPKQIQFIQRFRREKGVKLFRCYDGRV